MYRFVVFFHYCGALNPVPSPCFSSVILNELLHTYSRTRLSTAVVKDNSSSKAFIHTLAKNVCIKTSLYQVKSKKAFKDPHPPLKNKRHSILDVRKDRDALFNVLKDFINFIRQSLKETLKNWSYYEGLRRFNPYKREGSSKEVIKG